MKYIGFPRPSYPLYAILDPVLYPTAIINGKEKEMSWKINK